MDNEEYLIVVSDTNPGAPLANVSRKNFLRYEKLDNNTMRIWHRQLDPHSQRWGERYVEFKIHPKNEHMLKVIDW